MTPMSDYLQSSSIPFLTRRGVSDAFIEYTMQVIERQGTSLLRNWDDLSFRKTVLLLGSEEGPFYEPAGKADTKCFVVVVIRNSPLETLQSKTYQESGLVHAFSDDDVKAITGKAIRYFNKKDFSALCQQAKSSLTPDLYREAAARYPVAWSALRHLANTSAKVVDYEKVPFEQPYTLDKHMQAVVSQDTGTEILKVRSVFDGYSPELDPQLIELLHWLAETNGIFTVDSFKAATRNVENLLKIIEVLLTHDGAFVTPNYYLRNGHVER